MPTTGAMSNYLESALASHVLQGVTYTAPAVRRLALFKQPVTDADLEAGTIANEVSGGGYTRMPITFNNPTVPGGVSTNNGLVTFPTATAPWGTVTHFAIMDANAVGTGNVLIYGILDNQKVVDVDDVFQLPDTNLSITFS